jgi:hypothetical protein
MAQQVTERNPFMLMISPEVILAAMEKSEHLGQLNRHLCRPLDRLTPAATVPGDSASEDEGMDGDELRVNDAS